MAKPTTHQLETKYDSKGNFFQCARCSKESGASNRGQADSGMGTCVSGDGADPAVLETPTQARAHGEMKASMRAAEAANRPTPRQIGYAQVLIGQNPLTSQDRGYTVTELQTMTRRDVSALIDDLKVSGGQKWEPAGSPASDGEPADEVVRKVDQHPDLREEPLLVLDKPPDSLRDAVSDYKDAQDRKREAERAQGGRDRVVVNEKGFLPKTPIYSPRRGRGGHEFRRPGRGDT